MNGQSAFERPLRTGLTPWCDGVVCDRFWDPSSPGGTAQKCQKDIPVGVWLRFHSTDSESGSDSLPCCTSHPGERKPSDPWCIHAEHGAACQQVHGDKRDKGPQPSSFLGQGPPAGRGHQVCPLCKKRWLSHGLGERGGEARERSVAVSSSPHNQRRYA